MLKFNEGTYDKRLLIICLKDKCFLEKIIRRIEAKKTAKHDYLKYLEPVSERGSEYFPSITSTKGKKFNDFQFFYEQAQDNESSHNNEIEPVLTRISLNSLAA